MRQRTATVYEVRSAGVAADHSFRTTGEVHGELGLMVEGVDEAGRAMHREMRSASAGMTFLRAIMVVVTKCKLRNLNRKMPAMDEKDLVV